MLSVLCHRYGRAGHTLLYNPQLLRDTEVVQYYPRMIKPRRKARVVPIQSVRLDPALILCIMNVERHASLRSGEAT